MKIQVASPWTSAIALALAIAAALALAPAAAAQTPIPPGNSAVNQYTESYPSAGGDRRAGGDGDGRTPAQTLGRRKARRLEAQGPAGEATAALVAATAPGSIDAGAPSGPSGGPAERVGPGSGATSNRAGGSPLPSDPSGPSEVLGQATGLSTTGALFTLAILLTALWALAYLWRRRRTDSSAGA